MTRALVQTRKLRVNACFFPITAQGQACTWSEDRHYQDWDVANRLPDAPFLSLSSFFLLAYSPSLASFWLIQLGFCGSSQREQPWSQTEGPKPGVLGEPSGPWGWAERWGTDTVVWDKRVSFIANHSHWEATRNGEAYSCTSTLREWLDSTIQLKKLKKRGSHVQADDKQAGKPFSPILFTFSNNPCLNAVALSPVYIFARFSGDLWCSRG